MDSEGKFNDGIPVISETKIFDDNHWHGVHA